MKFKTILFFLLLASSTVLRAGEKAYLHLDNSAYFLGDTIRMAAYVMDTDTKQLTNKSKVLYVEMLAPEGYILERRTYPLENGECAGDIAISPLVVSGLFEIRAYTRYMQNDGQTNYYSQVVPVYEPVENGQYQNLVMQKGRLRNTSQNKDDRGRKPQPWTSNYQQPVDAATSRLVVEASYDEATTTPYGLTIIKLKGTPNAHLSLSIADADNYIHIPHETVADFVNGSIFVDKTGSMRKYEPEQELTLYGKAGVNIDKGINSEVFQPIPHSQLSYVFMPFETHEKEMAVADPLGNFKINMGKFVGNHYLLLNFLQLPKEGRDKLIIDYDLEPPCKLFTKAEMELAHSVTMNGKSIAVEQQKKGSKVFDVYHIDILKEVDRAYNNNYPQGPFSSLMEQPLHEESLYRSSTLERYCLDRRYRNCFYGKINAWRYVALDQEYPGDQVLPISRDVSYDMDIRKFKEMVVRTDQPICSYYDFSKGKRPDLSSVTQEQRISGVYYTERNHDYVFGFESGIPTVITCMVPDTNHEWDNYLKYNNIPGCRYIKVSGFSTQLPYRLPNYSKSHPQADYRCTLYWNPSVQLDANGEATIQFFNNGTCKKFVISGEGVSEDGKAIVCHQSL